MNDWENNLYRAQTLACEAHAAQRYGDQPYEYHLGKVVGVLEQFGFNLSDHQGATLLAAGWLPDSLEDTRLTKERLALECGPEVAELVWLVTDEPGKNRKERKAATYQKTKTCEAAVILKLADRIANVESAAQHNPGLFKLYAREQPDFSRELCGVCQSSQALEMWAYLDRLFQNNQG